MHNLGAQAGRQQDWLAWWQAQISQELAGHVVQVVLKAGELVGYADSAAWCERLRYGAEDLLARAAERDPTIRRIRLKVSPGSAPAGRRR